MPEQEQNDPTFIVPPGSEPNSSTAQVPAGKNWFMRHIMAEILGIILAGAVLAGGYYWYESHKANTPNTPNQIQHQDETANWKTYKNTKFGYEIKYPNSVGVVSELDFAIVEPTNSTADVLTLTDKGSTFRIVIDRGNLEVAKSSVLGEKIARTFVKTQSTMPEVCVQVLTSAKNRETGEVRSFPTPCDVPEGWDKL